jgi:poly(hydroxyalkanoate) depolymerase family esterase
VTGRRGSAASRPVAGAVAVALLLVVAVAGTRARAQERRVVADGPFKRAVVEGRAYRLYVPRAVADAPDEAPALPLVVALHGCWQTPEDFATGTRLNEAAERRGLLVVYPMQGHADHPSRCWNWYEPDQQTRDRRGAEAAQILAIVAEVRREQRVDGERVVVIGLSAGGFMAVNLACAAPDVVAGIGVVAGGAFRCGVGPDAALDCMRGLKGDAETSASLCLAAMGARRSRPVRASVWHGEDDVVVNPVNLATLAGMLARVDGATAAPPEKTEAATRTVYRDAAGRALVETWLVHHMGHAWPGGDPRGTNTFPAGPDATTRILDFLLPDG